MTPSLLKNVRRGLFVLGALASIFGNSGRDTATTPADASIASVREARLRKLHLVRPDLISYPIASEVVC